MKKQLLLFIMFASTIVAVNAQLSAPSISFDCKDGETEVTITNTDGSEIWYNFTGSNSTDDSQRYFAPFSLEAPTDVTAFVMSGDSKSEKISKRVVVKNARVRIDLLSAFNPSNTYDKFASNEGYCFDWKDEPTSGMKEEVELEGGAWKLISKGQVIQTKQMKNNSTIYLTNYDVDRPASPTSCMDKLLFTQSYQTLYDDVLFFGAAADADDYAEIRTAGKFTAPVDIIVLASKKGVTKELTTLNLETSPDGESWTQVGSINLGLANSWEFNRLSYEGTDEVYIRVVPLTFGSYGAQIHGIYIVNAGEQSLAKKAEYDAEYNTWLETGINGILTDSSADDAYYTLDGRKVNGEPTEKGVYIYDGRKFYVK